MDECLTVEDKHGSVRTADGSRRGPTLFNGNSYKQIDRGWLISGGQIRDMEFSNPCSWLSRGYNGGHNRASLSVGNILGRAIKSGQIHDLELSILFSYSSVCGYNSRQSRNLSVSNRERGRYFSGLSDSWFESDQPAKLILMWLPDSRLGLEQTGGL